MFKIGDRVKINPDILAVHLGGTEQYIRMHNIIGIIRHQTAHKSFLVEFDRKFPGGHDGGTEGVFVPNGTGRYISANWLALHPPRYKIVIGDDFEDVDQAIAEATKVATQTGRNISVSTSTT